MSSVSPRSRSPSPSGRRSRRGQQGLSALPGPEQRAELLRIAELYTSAAASSRGTPPPPATPTQSLQGDVIAPPSRDSSQDSSGRKIDPM